MKPPNGINTILYDLDGTLRLNQPSSRSFFIDYLLTLGLKITGEDQRREGFWEHRYWAESTDMLQDQFNYPMPEDFWTNYARRQLGELGCTPEEAHALAPEMYQYMNDNYHPEDALFPGTRSVLQELSAAGYVLGVVSNRDKPFRDYLTKKGLGGYVAFSLSSGEVGSRKPHKGIFEHALRLAGSTAEETIYVGDNYFADVVGARGAGIHPLLFDPEGIFDELMTSPGEALDCPVIRSHIELPGLLDRRGPWPGNGR
jgi:putative hydrolase of the HAD superfamily